MIDMNRMFSGDGRFSGDDLPDGTWGLCRIHAPTDHGIVRLVDAEGFPCVGGICAHCREEGLDEGFSRCPVHGLQPKVQGIEGCPVAGCLGESPGPTEDEIEREAESIRRLWVGGHEDQQNALVPQVSRPSAVGIDRPGGGPQGESSTLPGHDYRGGKVDQARDAGTKAEGRVIEPVSQWRDPFLLDES